MATLQQIGDALKRAAAAGDTAAATKLAAAYKAMQAQQQSAGPRASVVNPNAAQTPGAFGNNPAAQDMPSGAPPATFDQNIRAFGANIDQIPFAGPPIYNAMRQARATVQGMSPEQVDAETAQARQAAPGADLAGKVFYNVAPYAVAGALAPKVFGMGEAVPWAAGPQAVAKDIGLRSLAAGGSNFALGTADSMVRGADPLTAAKDNVAPSLAMAALPPLGAAVRGIGKLTPKALNWASGNLAPTIGAFWNTEKAGQKAVGRAMAADRAAGVAMSPADEAFARAHGLDLINLDLGGPATRNLARSAKATSPEATAALTSAVDRGAPGVDTTGFLTKLVGGSADDLALRSQLEDTARLVNDPAYKRAYSSPAAQSVWTPQIQQLLIAPEMQKAIRQAEGTGKTWAALHGSKPVTNPFVFKPDGTVSMKPGVTPTLQFWDQVQRNLRGIEESLPPGGEAASRVGQLRRALNGSLDSAIPEFKTARQGAAAFFGADNALDAGRMFALQPKNLPEAKAAIAKMSPPDRKAFEIGAASSAIDTLKSKDTFASVKQVFGSPAAREFWAATLGPGRAAQLESYVKVQAMQEASKQAVIGGSQTHDLLIGSGMMAGGFAANQFGIDPRLSGAAMFVGAARFARGSLGRMVDRKVLTSAAQLLASGDKAALNKVVANASMSPKWRATLDALFEGMAATSRGAVAATIGPSAAMAQTTPQADTRDYSNGLPPALSPGPRVLGAAGS